MADTSAAIRAAGRAYLDWTILDYGNFWVPFLVGVMLHLVPWAPSLLRSRRTAWVLPFVLLWAAPFAYGAVVEVNCLCDDSTPALQEARVVDKGRYLRGAMHSLTVAPVVGNAEEKPVRVRKEVDMRYAIGDTPSVRVFRGKLGVPWLAVK